MKIKLIIIGLLLLSGCKFGTQAMAKPVKIVSVTEVPQQTPCRVLLTASDGEEMIRQGVEYCNLKAGDIYVGE